MHVSENFAILFTFLSSLLAFERLGFRLSCCHSRKDGDEEIPGKCLWSLAARIVRLTKKNSLESKDYIQECLFAKHQWFE